MDKTSLQIRVVKQADKLIRWGILDQCLVRSHKLVHDVPGLCNKIRLAPREKKCGARTVDLDATRRVARQKERVW